MTIKLDDLIINITETGKTTRNLLGIISVSQKDILIVPCSRTCPYFKNEGCDYTKCSIDFDMSELGVMSAIACMYINLYEQGIILKANEYVSKGINLYNGLHQKYEGVKSIEKMTQEEFNVFMKNYDGRNKN